MATYNGERFVFEQINSILQQLNKDDELIVVDDHSNDNTRQIISEFRDSRICMVENKINLGPIHSFERALNLSHGDFILFSDQDDVWDRNKVKCMLKCFSDTNADIVVHDSRVVDGNRRLIDESWNHFNSNYFPSSSIRTLIKNPYTGANMGIRRSVLKLVLPFPSNIPMHDWWIGYLAGKHHLKVELLDSRLLDYRRYGGNVTGGKHMPRKMIIDRLNLLRSALGR